MSSKEIDDLLDEHVERTHTIMGLYSLVANVVVNPTYNVNKSMVLITAEALANHDVSIVFSRLMVSIPVQIILGLGAGILKAYDEGRPVSEKGLAWLESLREGLTDERMAEALVVAQNHDAGLDTSSKKTKAVTPNAPWGKSKKTPIFH